MDEDIENPGEANNPVKIYFYLVTEHNTPWEEYVAIRGSEVTWDTMDTEIVRIARAIEDGYLERTNSTHGDRVWKKKSYYVIYYKENGQKLDPQNPVTFTGPVGHNPFRHRRVFEAPNGAWVFYCVNHMTGAGDRPQAPDDRADYAVTVNHIPVEARADKADEQRLSHGDSGTNTGPP